MPFEDGLTDTVSVERDVNADGSATDAEGHVDPIWEPVTGLSSVPCRISEDAGARRPSVDSTEDVTMATLLMPSAAKIPRSGPIRFAAYDADAGTTIYYYAEGKQSRPRSNCPYQKFRCRLGAID